MSELQEKKHQFGLHILVAEDNKVNQLVARKLLEQLGCTCVIASDGKECIELLEQEDFHMILMDCVMPNMDGLEATQAIRASGNTLPIIAFTANAMDSDRLACHEAGMNGYMDKPIDMQRMVTLLTNWADKLGL